MALFFYFDGDFAAPASSCSIAHTSPTHPRIFSIVSSPCSRVAVLGENVEQRRAYIERHALEVKELDV